MVVEKALAGPIGIFVKFSVLQDYGVDKVFFLENENIDSSQKNVVFLIRGENAARPLAVAGMLALLDCISNFCLLSRNCLHLVLIFVGFPSSCCLSWDQKVDYVDIPYSIKPVLIPTLSPKSYKHDL